MGYNPWDYEESDTTEWVTLDFTSKGKVEGKKSGRGWGVQ